MKDFRRAAPLVRVLATQAGIAAAQERAALAGGVGFGGAAGPESIRRTSRVPSRRFA